MKRLISILIFLLAIPAFAQNFTSVTASQIEDASGGLLQSGSVCFQPVNAVGQPTNFMAGGGGTVHSEQVCRSVVNGAIQGGLSLASSNFTSPVGIQYKVTVTDDVAGTTLGLGTAFICAGSGTGCQSGTSWSLDNFTPTNVETLPFAGLSFISGGITASGAITAPDFHGVADSALLSGAWVATPQGCPNGEFSPTFDIHGNSLNCQLPNGQTSTGSVAGTVALNPTGNQMVTLPNGSFQRFGSANSYSQIAYDGTIHAFSLIEKGPKINVLHPDFGTPSTCSTAADPTGTFDSACSINAALNYAASLVQSNSGTRCIYVPAGTYLLNSEVRVPPGLHICGDGPNQTFFKVTNQWQNAFTLLNGGATGMPGGSDNFTTLEGFTIQGNGHLTSGTAIEFLSADRGAIKDVNIANWGGRGFNMWGDTERWNMIDVRFSRVRWPLSTNFQTNEDHWFGLFGDDSGDTDDGYTWNRNAVNGVVPAANSQAPVAATWTANTQYHGGDFINDGTTNCSGGPCNQRATQDFVSGATIPTFTGGDGTTTNDGVAPFNGSWLNVSNRTQWLPDYHCGFVFNGNNNDIWGASIKPNRTLCGLQWGGTNGEIHDIYFEGAFGGFPLVNAAIQAGGFADHLTLTSAVTATQTTIPISDTNWVPNFLTNVSDANSSIGKNTVYGFTIVCADAKPGSTTPCAAHPSIQQGQSEHISCGVASSDGSIHQCQRCTSGSSIGCTANTGFAWSAGDIVISPTEPGSPTGAVTVYNSHFTTPFNATNGTGYISACNQSKVGGFSCGTVIAGAVIDGLAITRPFTDPTGFSGSPRQTVVLQDNRFNACCSVTDGIGLIDIPFAGDVTLRESGDPAVPYPVDANSIMYAANGQPVGFFGNRGYRVNFGQYSGGNAQGSFNAPEDGVSFSPNGNYFISGFRATTTTETLPGLSVNPGYCLFDVALKGAANSHPNTRWCFHSGTSTQSAFTSLETWNGSAWSSAWTLGTSGLNQAPVGGVGFGTTANFVQNSINLSGAGWSAVSGGPASITAGATDPNGGNQATKLVFPSSGTNVGLTNATTFTLTTGVTNTACMWARTDNPGLVLQWGVQTGANPLPPNQSIPLTATWQRLQMSAINASTAQPIRFGVASASGQDVYIYDPLVWNGNGCPSDLPTTTPVQTPIPIVNVGNGQVIAGGAPAVSASSATPTGTCTANGFVTENINGSPVHVATCN